MTPLLGAPACAMDVASTEAALPESASRRVDASVDPAAGPSDSASTLADALSQRAELFLLATQGHQQRLQARLDRMRAEFNATQEERSERLRELNMLRDMAMEQAKADNEILKKYIAMI